MPKVPMDRARGITRARADHTTGRRTTKRYGHENLNVSFNCVSDTKRNDTKRN